MRASVRLGRIFGVEVGLHWSVLVIATLLLLGLTEGTHSVAEWIVAGIIVVVFLASLLAHELAHSVVARRAGIEVKGITLWMLGGVAQLNGRMPSAGAEFRIAAAGPATSIGLAMAFGALAGLGHWAGVGWLAVSALIWLALVNGVLAIFNLIPAAPLDGGRILASALWAHHGDQRRADVAASRAGQVFGGLMIGFGLLGELFGVGFGTLWTALLGWFVIVTARAEQRHAQLDSSLAELRVADVMSPHPETVRGWMTVDSLAREAQVSPPRHWAYPVERWEGGIAGLVTIDQLQAVPVDRRTSTRVIDVSVPIHLVEVALPDERLIDVVARSPRGSAAILVFDAAHQLVGIVTPADLQRAPHVQAEAQGPVV